MEKTWTIKNLPAIWETQVQSPGEGHGNPPWYSCLENSMDRGAWRAKVHWVAESDMTVTNTHTRGKDLLNPLRTISKIKKVLCGQHAEIAF